MHLWHPILAYFAAAFFVAALLAEGLNLFTGKRFWALVAKYHIISAAILSFLAVLSGIIDFKYIWEIETGYQFLHSHAVIGFALFVIIQLMANYRFVFQKILPAKYKTVYLVLGGLGLGLVFGASYMGKTAVYYHGTGVRAAMFKFQQTEEYLKHLYNLDRLDDPALQDSLRSLPYRPGDDGLGESCDTLAQNQIPDDVSIHH
jgi:uncharacterized membrane protein